VLLHRGGRARQLPLDPHPGGLPCIASTTRAPTGATEPQPDAGLNGRTLLYPRGKTLGGCSSINGMIYMRGQARDYDTWAQLTGEPAWAWQHCLPDFIRMKVTIN
jgi:choline dehydrogenase